MLQNRDSRESELTIFEGYLRERGLKMTGPRGTVLRAFLSQERHVTAEEVFTAARLIDPSIGQATVFRTIKLLADAGLAKEACRDDGARQFEQAFGHGHHDHLVCLACGTTIEFVDPAIEAAQEAVYRIHGFEPSGHRLELLGYCSACAGKRT